MRGMEASLQIISGHDAGHVFYCDGQWYYNDCDLVPNVPVTLVESGDGGVVVYFDAEPVA